MINGSPDARSNDRYKEVQAGEVRNPVLLFSPVPKTSGFGWPDPYQKKLAGSARAGEGANNTSTMTKMIKGSFLIILDKIAGVFMN